MMQPQDLEHGTSKQKLKVLIEGLSLSDLQKDFLCYRWLDQVSWMGGRAKYTRNWYYRLRLTTIICGATIPLLVGLNFRDLDIHSLGINDQCADALESILRFIAHTAIVVLSLSVAISAGIEEFFHFGERWQHYRRTAESLKTQGWQFFQLSGSYQNFESHEKAFPTFATQIEEILQHDVEVYVTQVVQEKKQEAKKEKQET